MPSQQTIQFRPLATSDFPSLCRWLADPDVARWWPKDDLSLEAIIGKFQPVVDGSEPVRGFIIAIDGVDAGYIQAYRIDDHPAYARQIDLPSGSVATDLFLGEPSLRGMGWAVPMLRAFLQKLVFGDYKAEVAAIAPTPDNLRAIHVYERAGFQWRKTVVIADEESPLDSGNEYVMTMTRDEFATASVAGEA